MEATGAGRRGGRRGVGRARGHDAFTTLELLVVVAILGILAAFGMPPLLGALERSRLEAGTGELVGALRRAQALAVSRGGFFRVHLGSDPAVGRPNSYRVERNSGAGWPAPADTVATSPFVETDWVDLAAQYAGLTVGIPKDNGGNDITSITYNSRGALVDPSSLPARIPVQNLSRISRTVVAEFARAARAQ